MDSGFACAPRTIDPASLVTIGNPVTGSLWRCWSPFWCFFELPFSKGSATKAPQEFRSPDYQARRPPGRRTHHHGHRGRRRDEEAMKSALPISIGFLLALCSSAFAQPAPAAPAEMISNYRVQHGEGPVTSDPTLNRIAHEQAAAMASKDLLDHNSALAPFASRVAAAKSQRSAENIAYGYDSFPKTLDMWIDSPAHQKNLLMPGALKVGVASAKSSTTHRTYWAMVITSGERPQSASSSAHRATPRRNEEACRVKILGLCL